MTFCRILKKVRSKNIFDGGDCSYGKKIKQNQNILCVSPHIAPTHGYGGPAIVFRSFLELLEENKIHYTSISTSCANTFSINDDKRVEIFFKSFMLHKYAVSFGIALYLIANGGSFKKYVINGLSTMPVLLAVFIALLLKKDVILFTHGGLESTRTLKWGVIKRCIYWLNIIILNSLNKNDQLLVVYQSKDEQMKSDFETSNYLICSNYPTTFFQKRMEKNYSKLSVTYIGRLSPEKGLDRLLQLLEYFTQEKVYKKHEFNLIVAGVVDERLQKFLWHPNINLYQDLGWDEIKNILHFSNVIYFPSRIENFGNSLVEGIAYGLTPCLYNDTHWSVLLDHDAALSEHDLKKMLQSNNIDHKGLSKVAEKARNIVIDEFIRDKDMTQILGYLD